MSVSVSVRRLRGWLLAGVGLLVLVVAAFLGFAYYRAHRFLAKLPERLGVDVQQEANGYTYSQTVGGVTVYTIHAAKERQNKGGKITLFDVGIVVYGKKQDRADRIYGKEFEFDQAAGVVKAMGDVFIDLQAPAPADPKAKRDYAAGKDLKGADASAAGAKPAGAGAADGSSQKLIHIKTSGLIYQQKLGVAATDKDIEFTTGGLVGHAVGADYNSDTGVVVLHSAVRVNGLQHERPIVLTASQAVLDRQAQMATLTEAKYVVVGRTGETAEAQHAVVHLRKDGTAERLDGSGEVTLSNGEGGTVRAPRGVMMISAENHPQSAVLSGGVRYGEDTPLRQAQGESADAHAAFDKAGQIEHLTMNGGVHLREQTRISNAVNDLWTQRELSAAAAELAMATDGNRKTVLKDAKATGNARLNVVNPPVAGGGVATSAMAGDVLTAHFVRLNGADHVSEVHGDGHASLRRVNAKGVVNTSSGDSLVAKFRPGGAQGQKTGAGGHGDEVSSAVEQGHVVMTQVPVKKPGDTAAPSEERATAERAVYDGDLERTTLTGSVQVNDQGSVLWADRVVTEQGSGDSTADGAVKVSYRQPGSTEETTHVLAARGDFKHDAQVATFYGGAGRMARLWQGTSQVEAPVIRLEQKEKRLLAHGEGQGAPGAVHTVLVNHGVGGGVGTGNGSSAVAGKKDAEKGGSSAGKGGAAGAAGSLGGKADVVRIVSRDLVYADELRRADFTGGVQVQSADGTMRGQQAVVYLKAAAAGKAGGAKGDAGKADGAKASAAEKTGGKGGPGATAGLMGGDVDHVVATGHIEMEQPGRRATGEQVVYTASDGMFTLTGTAAVPPKVIDEQRGTVTGASLQFHSGDENVVVSNGEGAGQRVHTETRVKNKE